MALTLASVSIYRNMRSDQNEKSPENLLTNVISAEKKLEEKKPVASENQMTERVDFDSSVLVQERSYTEKEIQDMTEEQFIQLLKEVELRLPKLSDIKKIPAEALHRTPAPVLQAGKELGLIKEILKLHESYEVHAGIFYQSCAINKLSLTPVRALCLTNLVEVKRKKGEKINKSLFSKEIIDLSSMITDI